MNKKVIDIDNVFDDFLVKYINENKGKFTEKQWEEKIPVMYLEFGSTALEELDGATPEEYYSDLTGEELAKLLAAHVEKEVPVSDFLCEALIKSDCEKYLVNYIDNEHDQTLVAYSVNVLNDKKSTLALDRYLNLILSDQTCNDMKELLAESLVNHAELVKEQVLENYEKAGVNSFYLLEILSVCKKDDRVLEILLNELKSHLSDIPVYVNYIMQYGDEKALPTLLELIDNEKINYVDFKELKFAIEFLGGEYTKERDFSNDKYYKRIKGVKNETSSN